MESAPQTPYLIPAPSTIYPVANSAYELRQRQSKKLKSSKNPVEFIKNSYSRFFKSSSGKPMKDDARSKTRKAAAYLIFFISLVVVLAVLAVFARSSRNNVASGSDFFKQLEKLPEPVVDMGLKKKHW